MVSEQPSEQEVRAFLRDFERAQATQDFAEVVPLIHQDAIFRFNDGDYRGIDRIRAAFEATWSIDVEDERYRIEDVEVERVGPDWAVATFRFVWSGIGPNGPFEVNGRGTTAVVMEDGGLKVLVEHLSR